MLISELAKEVHENAVAHGWWDEARELPELVALIHSEWSEALEEARAGRPLVWYACGESENGTIPCNPADDNECRMYGREEQCEYRGHKPEGIAVELIDGCIRILDVIGYKNARLLDPETGLPSDMASLMDEEVIEANYDLPDDTPSLIAWLHAATSQALLEDGDDAERIFYLTTAMSMALVWVKKQGLDPLAILLEKHAYNKTRPYKHGKKF